MTDERRDRYAAAIEAKLRDTAHALCYDPQDAAADAAMAVADEEQQATLPTTRRALEAWKKENARLRAELDRMREYTAGLEATLDRVQQVCHDLPYEYARLILAALDETELKQ